MAAEGPVPWHARPEAGHAAGLWLVERVARLCGRRVAHWFVAPVAAYFLLARPVERRASLQFLARALGRPARLADSLRHFHAFACMSVDRVFLLAGGGRDIALRVSGQQQMEAVLARGSGCILLSAHLGSFEAARQAGLVNPALRLRLLLDRAVNRRLVERLERIDPRFAADIIDAAGEPMALTLRIGESLRAGEWVGWLGDRHRAGERTVQVDFLGAPARFPASPFIIAHLFRVPVFLVLALTDGDGYRLVVEELVGEQELATTDRDAFVAAQVGRFAGRLAHHARSAPTNWSNFYDFWSA